MRILIATVTAGGGHLAAAAALEEAWRALRPEDVVQRVDLVKFFSPLHRKIHAEGYLQLVQHAPELWGMLFTKPGGLTSSEALALGKPLFILDPIPGQEAANSDFLLEHGAAAKANRVEDLPYRLGQLLGTKKLTAMAGAAQSLGRPGAAEAVCRAVLKRLEQTP